MKKKNLDIFLRKDTTDLQVFKQVFVLNEYGPVIDFILLNRVEVLNIIDAGSNIGLTTLKLYEHFPEANFYCIEPDFNNFHQLEINLKYLAKANLFRNALWHKNEKLAITADFRDGGEWSRAVQVGTNEPNLVDSLTVAELIATYRIGRIDLLKIDVEGSERQIFGMDSEFSFLDKTKVICIEIHDEYGCRERICDVLVSKGFILFNSGELTIGINERF